MKFFVFISILFSLCTSFADNTVSARIDQISASYLGLPYITDPLGEGKGYDTDPLYRFDGFDCTTYVETVLAQTYARNESDLLTYMNAIRYKNGRVRFKSRNHFVNIDWIVNNYKNGLLRDVTFQHFPEYYKVSQTLINKSAWFKQVHKMHVWARPRISRIAYVPLNIIFQNPTLLDRIHSGSIINIVRPNWQLADKIGTNLDVSHQAFAIRKSDGVLYIRHASVTDKQVTEMPLLPYLEKFKDSPTVGGINILEVTR